MKREYEEENWVIKTKRISNLACSKSVFEIFSFNIIISADESKASRPSNTPLCTRRSFKCTKLNSASMPNLLFTEKSGLESTAIQVSDFSSACGNPTTGRANRFFEAVESNVSTAPNLQCYRLDKPNASTYLDQKKRPDVVYDKPQWMAHN